MAKDRTSPSALAQWRAAEEAYLAQAAPWLAEGDAPKLTKNELLELISLRGKADRAREDYFRLRREE